MAAGLRPAAVVAMVLAAAAMATVTGEEATAAANDFLLASVSSHRPGPNFSVGAGPIFSGLQQKLIHGKRYVIGGSKLPIENSENSSCGQDVGFAFSVRNCRYLPL